MCLTWLLPLDQFTEERFHTVTLTLPQTLRRPSNAYTCNLLTWPRWQWRSMAHRHTMQEQHRSFPTLKNFLILELLPRIYGQTLMWYFKIRSDTPQQPSVRDRQTQRRWRSRSIIDVHVVQERNLSVSTPKNFLILELSARIYGHILTWYFEIRFSIEFQFYILSLLYLFPFVRPYKRLRHSGSLFGRRCGLFLYLYLALLIICFLFVSQARG